jgi:hypothetical protein
MCSGAILHVLPARRGRGRHARDEDDEDAELLRDEEADGGASQVHRLQVQPSILTGGTLREYQLQGLNWLIHLYDNGINGILADEMVRERMCCAAARSILKQLKTVHWNEFCGKKMGWLEVQQVPQAAGG